VKAIRCIFWALLGGLSLQGCSLHKPTAETLGKVPTVEFGQTAPATGDFILHFPAGKPIPITASVSGSALAQADQKTLTVTLKKDIYTYKEWVSFDRNTWQKSGDVLGFNLNIQVPSPEHPNPPGLMEMRVDLKQ
jgi:hypothetical protein